MTRKVSGFRDIRNVTAVIRLRYNGRGITGKKSIPAQDNGPLSSLNSSISLTGQGKYYMNVFGGIKQNPVKLCKISTVGYRLELWEYVRRVATAVNFVIKDYQ